MSENDKEVKNKKENPLDENGALFHLKKARIWLNEQKPFFGYLTMHLQFERKDEIGTMGVNKHGICYYNKDFVLKLSEDEQRGVLCHEVMHVVLKHLSRVESRDKRTWNVAADIIINQMILSDGMSLPSEGILPKNGTFELFGKKITKINKKTAEEVYNDIYDVMKQHQQQSGSGQSGDGDGDGQSMPKGFDKHEYDDEKKPKGASKGNEGDDDNGSGMDKSDAKDWDSVLTEATTLGQMQGNLPAGMQRRVSKLLGTYIDWKGLLYRYITNMIPYDFSYRRPHKKSHSLGTYFPEIEKEKLEVVISIDTSGSIGEKELTQSLSETIGILKNFNNVEMTIIFNDTEVYGPHKFQNPTPDRIMKVKPEGGGGTNHIPVFKWMNEKQPNAKLLICFTDGQTSYPDSPKGLNTIWVLLGSWRCDVKDIPFGKVVELPKE
jgi:predicted metal-dependent peptidase